LAQLGQLPVTAPAPVREPIQARSCTGKARRCRRLQADTGGLAEPAQATRYALRILAGRIPALETEIAALNAPAGCLGARGRCPHPGLVGGGGAADRAVAPQRRAAQRPAA
jgi:hypothetical protein